MNKKMHIFKNKTFEEGMICNFPPFGCDFKL